MLFHNLQQAQQTKHPVIVAELGAKYARMETITHMVRCAQECGADMIKFQTYQAETISTPGSVFTMADGSKISQYDFFKQHEFTRHDHETLVEYCRKLGIPWFSTPSHPTDVDLLETFAPIAYKTGSDDITNLPLLRYIAATHRPIVVSTGMSTLGEIEKAIETIFATGNMQVILLHCVVSYPSKPEDANLRTIETLQRAFGLPVGLSDHTSDEFTSILATQLGVVMIEKHFTIDYALNLPDSQCAVDPDGLKTLVNRVRLVPKALGDGIKRIQTSEEQWRAASRKSLFSSRPIQHGEIIRKDDITIRRPADGIHPHHLDLILGRRAVCDIPANTLISWQMV